MRKKHRKTLAGVFASPVRANIACKDIEALLIALGAEINEGSGSRVRVKLNDVWAVFRSIDELRQSLKDSVEDYLAWCAEEGKEPEKPFSGKFIVRIDPALHRKISTRAQAAGVSLNQLVSEALEKTLT